MLSSSPPSADSSDPDPASSRTGDAPSEQGPSHPDRWLAFLRIAVGLWFLKSLWTKLELEPLAGILPLPAVAARWVGFMPERVAEYAAGNPLEPYRWFLAEVVIPNGTLFAHLTAYAEVAIGIGLVLGLATRWASAVGLFVAINYLLATFWISQGQMGFHLLLAASMLAFLGGAAGRRWGLDGILPTAGRLRWPRSLPAQRGVAGGLDPSP